MSEVKPPPAEKPAGTRQYKSPRRQAQAQATRDAVIAAAQARFAELGYAGTTLDAVAADAQVSAATVYATFGSKRALLEAAVDQAIVGDSQELALADRPWVADLRALDDPKERLRVLYAALREVYERTAAFDRVVEDAARTDPELASLLVEHRRRQYEDTERLRDAIVDGRVFATLDERQDVEALWAIGGQSVYRLLTEGRGWAPETWEKLMCELTGRLLETRAEA
jgi:AcrR family transcriptional regulator